MQVFAGEDLRTVRRLTARSAIGVSARHALADGKRTVWNQIAYEGEWLGHVAGEFEFTRAVFEQIIANFERREDPIPLTYGHPDGETGSYMGAAGWIHALKIAPDDQGRAALWAEMEFTERAAGQVKSGEQRHCSVVVAFDAIDEKSGEPIGAELYEVGLVLSAFVDGMRPLAASGRNRKTTPARGGTDERNLAMDAKEVLQTVIDELPDGADVEQAKALLDAEVEKAKALEGETEEVPEPEGEMGDELPMGKADGDNAETVEAQGAPAVEAMEGEGMHGPGVEAIVAEIVAQGGDADPVAVDAFLAEYAGEIAAKFMGAEPSGGAAESDEVSALSLQVDALKAKLAKATEERDALRQAADEARDAELSKRIDAAIECGAFAEERREALLKLGRSDRDLFEDTIATATEASPPPGVPRKRLHRAASPSKAKASRATKAEQVDALTSREREFYVALSAIGKPHDEAIELAKRKSAERLAN